MTGLALVLARDEGHVVNPRTAALVPIANASTEELADMRDALTALDYDRKTAMHMIDEEIVRRTDAAIRDGEIEDYTFQVGAYKLEVDTGSARRVQVEQLRSALLEQVERGLLRLTPRAIEELFSIKRYLQLAKLRKLAIREPTLLAAYEEHSTPVRRAVKVTPVAQHERYEIEATAGPVS